MRRHGTTENTARVNPVTARARAAGLSSREQQTLAVHFERVP